jgi:hypothetical protein
MATLEQLENRVEEIIQRRFTGDVVSRLNEGLAACVAAVLLPELESSGEITTDSTGSVAIPDSWGYDRGLYSCSSSEGEVVTIVSSESLIEKDYPGFRTKAETGDVAICTIKAGNLVYYPIPTDATVLTCGFYKKHTDLGPDYLTPAILPAHLHYELLCSFAAHLIWDLVEDSVQVADGVSIKPNAIAWSNRFKKAILALDESVTDGQSKKKPTRNKGWI